MFLNNKKEIFKASKIRNLYYFLDKIIRKGFIFLRKGVRHSIIKKLA